MSQLGKMSNPAVCSLARRVVFSRFPSRHSRSRAQPPDLKELCAASFVGAFSVLHSRHIFSEYA